MNKSKIKNIKRDDKQIFIRKLNVWEGSLNNSNIHDPLTMNNNFDGIIINKMNTIDENLNNEKLTNLKSTLSSSRAEENTK